MVTFTYSAISPALDSSLFSFLSQGLNLLWASRQCFSFSALNSSHFLYYFQWEFSCDGSLFFGCFPKFSLFHRPLTVLVIH